MPNNYAFIDAQNLYRSVTAQGWKLDTGKFRLFLDKRFGVKKAFYFVGYVASNGHLYTKLRKQNYTLIFRHTFTLPTGRVKGNLDAELILHAMIEYPNYERAVIVAGDGDYACLANHLLSKNKLEKVIIPNRQSYSSLLRKLGRKRFFLDSVRKKVEYI